jgi:hypothetical protein
MKTKSSADKSFWSAFSILGAIVLASIICSFPGLIEIKVGGWGQVTIDGRQPTQIN